MKRLFLISILILSSFVCCGQYNRIKKFVPEPTAIKTLNITTNPVANGWGLIGQSCAGCPSFFFALLRSKEIQLAENGKYYYYYYVFLNSNSFYTNGNAAATYLEDISILENDKIIFNSKYILVVPNEQAYKIWIRSKDPFAKISFDIKNYKVH